MFGLAVGEGLEDEVHGLAPFEFRERSFQRVVVEARCKRPGHFQHRSL
jgi:hypothetical protein